jgi:hypothetical protein
MVNSGLVLVAVLVAATLPGQVPPTCFGFNMTPGAGYDYITAPWFAPLTIYFTAPQTVTADQVVLFENDFYYTSLNVAVHALNPATGLPLNPPLATAPGGAYFFGFDWIARTLSTPVSFIGGVSYALVCTPAPNLGPGYYVAGIVGTQTSPTPTLLTFTGGGFIGSSGGPPATTQLGFRFGFQGPACGAKIAELRPGGASCGGAQPTMPLLSPVNGQVGFTNGVARPALGQSMVLRLVPNTGANPTVPAALYWSVGTNLLGTPISPVCPCVHYLNPTSLATLAAGGFEPLATPTWWSDGSAWFVLAVPNLPSLIGTVIALQAVLVDPAGVPSGVPGVNIRLSNSLTLVPGL